MNKINEQNLGPGDRVYLNGGDEFSGSLYIAPEDAGSAADPVVIVAMESAVPSSSQVSIRVVFLYIMPQD